MVLKHLTYFVALAREQHFGRAAEACHVSQATLSEAIRRLETELGVPLVRRGHRFQGLTPEGERALDWAHRILADADGMRADLAALRDGVGGRLRLGAIPTSLPLVARLTVPLRERHPAVHVAIRSLSSREIERGLHEGELDVGLTYLENEPLRGVRQQPLYDERYVLVAPAGSRWARSANVRWRDAAGAPLCLLSPDMQNRRIVDALFSRAGAAPDPVVETNSISMLHAQVRDAGLCAVMADAWLHGLGVPAGMTALPLVEPAARQAVGVVWRDRDPEPALVRALVAVTREARSELAAA
ncbi:MAG TPA: LysR substrate-binding domain-containing protein [Conexibacter sp.]|nr:LysR substrate-binding domain-containing protein [Conexibacter sp.]